MIQRPMLKVACNLPIFITRHEIHTTAKNPGQYSRHVSDTMIQFKKRHNEMMKAGTDHKFKRSQLPNWNYDAELFGFNRRLNENFDVTLLREAFTDTSHIVVQMEEMKEAGLPDVAIVSVSNRELAQCGIPLIRNYCHSFMKATFPLLPEEGLSAGVDYLSSIDTLSNLAQTLGFKDLILSNELEPSKEMLANSFQAMVGALNSSSGLERTNAFIKDFVITQLIGKDVNDYWNIAEPVVVFQDILSRSGLNEAEPRLIYAGGSSSVQAFYEVAFYSDKKIVGKGYGETIPIATDQAALDGIRRCFKISISREPISMTEETVPTNNGPLKSLNTCVVSKQSCIADC